MFIGSTIFFVVFMVTCNHNFSTKGRPPQSWEQIWNDKWFYLGGCISRLHHICAPSNGAH